MAKTFRLYDAKRDVTIPARYGASSQVVQIPTKRKSALVLTHNDVVQLVREMSTPDELAELADTLKRASYWSHVRDLADDILARLKSGDIDSAERLSEDIHETCDGDGWVIYTASAQEVLRYSDNDGAYAENYGGDGIVQDGSINWSVLAYAALEADLQAQLLATTDLNAPFTCDECGATFDSHSDLELVGTGDDTQLLCPDCVPEEPEPTDDDAVSD